MKIEQIYTGCLAQGAYYIQSGNEAAIIDPLREISPYVEKAKANGATIKYIFETHFHADFVSGHVDLAKATGASIVYGPSAHPTFEAHIGADNEVFKIGDITITLLHTPGHTLESSCYLLSDAAGKNIALFSGDTLFIGDVGRPDLAQQFVGKTKEELAAMMFQSIRTRIMPLADDVIIYPAHGAGSACGKNMSKETSDTLGHQKEFNYALRADMTEEEFVKEVTTGLLPPPAYFPSNVMMNQQGYANIETVVKEGSRALDVVAFEALANETGALLLDTRKPQVFAQSFIPNSINIGIDGNFAPWVGALLLDRMHPILLIADEGRAEEVVTRLARVGYDNAIGYLEGGMEAWIAAGKETDSITSVTADNFYEEYTGSEVAVLDVRKPGEYDGGHIEKAQTLPLDFINDTMDQLDASKTYYVHCAGGYRSMIFISILKARGYNKLIDVAGGMGAIKATGKFPITEPKPVAAV